MSGELTSRERVQRALASWPHDRIPRHDTYWNETITRWRGEGFDGDAEAALERLGTDFHRQGRCFPTPFPAQWDEVARDDETVTVRNPWGATLRTFRDRSGTPEHVGFDCDGPDKWKAVYKPALLRTDVQIDLVSAAEACRRGRSLERFVFQHAGESFEWLRQLIGDEMTMVAMVEEPQWIADISRTFTDVVLRDLEAAWQAGAQPDGLWIYGDMAYKNATMCSPAMYRELIWPDHKRLADWAHQREVAVIFHTDGNVNGVVDLYLEAGFDCLQPLEAKAGMDVRTLAPKYGQRLALFGNIDVMVMATNNVERVEAEVRSKLAAGMANGNYLYHSDHSVPPGVSWSTYQRLTEMLDRYGRYE